MLGSHCWIVDLCLIYLRRVWVYWISFLDYYCIRVNMFISLLTWKCWWKCVIWKEWCTKKGQFCWSSKQLNDSGSFIGRTLHWMMSEFGIW